jgi:lactate dehydrogenase-like 2-hydroxyacid dehydrogenase
VVSPFRIAVTRRLPEAVEAELERSFDVERNIADRPLDAGGLRRALTEFDGVLCTLTDAWTADVLEASPLRARILANLGAGVDHIDLDAAERRGLVVTNTPDVLTDATADLTIALMLMVLRRLGEGERQVRAGRWPGWHPVHLLGHDVGPRVLGIVGFGRIGRAVARRASRGFGMRVLAWGPRPAAAAALEQVGAATAGSLDELLEDADVVSLHCPLTPQTHHLMDRARLARMRPGSVLINTARGPLVDELALIAALARGRPAGAGLDVYEHEPEVPEPLRQAENVVCLPHLGSATVETRTRMGLRAVANLRAFCAGEQPPDAVRAPGRPAA